jgi:hypothetical protein
MSKRKMTLYVLCVDEMTVDQKRCCPENCFERCELTIDSNLSFGQFHEANLQLPKFVTSGKELDQIGSFLSNFGTN